MSSNFIQCGAHAASMCSGLRNNTCWLVPPSGRPNNTTSRFFGALTAKAGGEVLYGPMILYSLIHGTLKLTDDQISITSRVLLKYAGTDKSLAVPAGDQGRTAVLPVIARPAILVFDPGHG